MIGRFRRFRELYAIWRRYGSGRWLAAEMAWRFSRQKVSRGITWR